MADDWGEGYVTDVAYVHTFLPGLAPLNLALAALAAGVRPPEVDAPFAYLDVGCGNGFTPALIAAANPQAEVWGNDFNPAHVASARALAEAAGARNATFLQASFAEMVGADLPQFDMVVAHGIWSWVSEANRQRIVELLGHRVKPGGLVMVSYACHPGCDPLLPLRRLMIETRGSGGEAERIDRALATARALRDAGAALFRDNPAAAAALDRLDGQDRAYLAHEYLNGEWRLFHAREVADMLAPAGLAYVGQAQILDTLEFGLTPEQRAVADAEPAARELLRDMMVNRRFRRDLFVREDMAIGEVERAAWLGARRFVRARSRAACAEVLDAHVDEIGGQRAALDAVLDALGEEPAAIAERPGELLLLAGLGLVQPVLAAADAGRGTTAAFNAAVLESARTGDPLPALASPLTGSGVAVPAGELMLLDALRFGVPLEAMGEGAAGFAAETLPLLERLGIA